MDTSKQVYFITFEPLYDDPTLKSLKENVNLHYKFLSVKGNDMVKQKAGQLGENAVKKASYKAQVIDYLAKQCPWIAASEEQQEQILDVMFQAEKDTFHQELLAAFTRDLHWPKSSIHRLEGIIINIRNSIKQATGSGGSDSQKFHISATTYHNDGFENSRWYHANIRSIYFRIDESLSLYIKGKAKELGGSGNASVKFDYAQTVATFDNNLFEGKAKSALQESVQGQYTHPSEGLETFNFPALDEKIDAAKMKRLEGMRFKGPSVNVYLVLDETAREVWSQPVYAGLFGSDHDIHEVSQEVMDSMPKGPAITAVPPLVKPPNSYSIYLIDEGKKRWIRTMETFYHYGFAADQIARIDLDQYPEGASMAI